jgi:hypothetical protein
MNFIEEVNSARDRIRRFGQYSVSREWLGKYETQHNWLIENVGEREEEWDWFIDDDNKLITVFKNKNDALLYSLAF